MVLIVVGFCAASGATLYQMRRDNWNRANTSQTNLLNVLSQNIAENIEDYDLSLRAVAEGLAEPELSGLSPPLQNRLLYESTYLVKDLGPILVLDRTGRVIRGSTPGFIGADLSGRDYFTAQRADPGRGLFIGAPFTGGVKDAEEVIGLSRSLRSADGSFAGVVVGTMRLAQFQTMFSRSDVGPRGAISLFRLDGVCLIRVPSNVGQIGRSFAGTANFDRFLQSPAGTFTGKAVVDGVRRIYSFARIGGYPLVLSVALAEDDVFSVWRTRSITIGLALVVLCATAAALGMRLKRQFDRTVLTEQMLSSSEADYRLLADLAQDVIMRLDRSLRRTYVSPAVSTVLGYAPEDLLGRSPQAIIHPDDWPMVITLMLEAQSVRGNTEATYRVRHKSGHYVWMEGRYSSLPEDEGFIVVLRDITKRKAAEEQLEAVNAELAHIASVDALTGLSNRRRFDAVLDAEWRRAKRDRRAISLLMLDVDRFKAYNDRYGHQQGDVCLRAVAAAVENVIRRPGDLVARYGGEEIAIILPETDEAGAVRVAERIRLTVEELRMSHAENQSGGSVVTASVGCATMIPGDDPAGAAALVAQADARLYEAKRAGRNRVGTSVPTSPAAPRPPDEAERLAVLAAYEEAGAAGHAASLDNIARMTARLFGVPIAFVSLVGSEDVTIAGRHGLETQSVPREATFCSHAILGDQPLVLPDTSADPRFADNPFTKAGIGFYAGAPLRSPIEGRTIGALCIADDHARPLLDDDKRELLTTIASLVVDDLERRRTCPDPGETTARNPPIAA